LYSYITALEERCAQLESAIIQVNPLHEAVQDHLGSSSRNTDCSQSPIHPGEDSHRAEAPEGAAQNARALTTIRTKRLERPQALNAGKDAEELEGTIRDYLEDLSTKAFAEMPYVGELHGMTFAKLAKA
jgi:hypothetical protein